MSAVPGLRPADGSRAADGMGTARARCVLAPNPSPMTLDGTNTWIIAEPGSPTAVTLAELAACGDVDTALAGPRQVVPRIPELLMREGAAWLTVPGVSEYPI